MGATRRPLLLLLLDEIVYSPVSSVDSAKAVLQIRTRVLNEDWEDTFRGWYPGFRPKLENKIKQAA